MLVLSILWTIFAIPIALIWWALLLVWILFKRIVQLIGLILVNLPTVILLGLFFAGGLIWFSYHDKILTKVDILLRCELLTWYNENWRDIVEVASQVWENVVCWTNALAHWNRFFTGTFLAKEFGACSAQSVESTGGFWLTFGTLLLALSEDMKVLLFWVVSGLFVDVLPLYNLFHNLLPWFTQLQILLTCICNDLRPVLDIVVRLISDNALNCTLHYYGNSFLTLVQQIFSYGWHFTLQLFALIFGGGTFDELVNLFFREVTSLALPDLTFATERAYAGALNLGTYFDNFLLILACTISSEIQGNLDTSIIYPAYDSCYNNKVYRVPVFNTAFTLWAILIFPSYNFPATLSVTSLLSGFTFMFSPGYRVWNLVYSLIVNWFRELDPTQNFLIESQLFDRVLDTIRDPSPRMNTTSTIWSYPPNNQSKYGEFDIGLPDYINETQIDLNAAALYGANFNGGFPLNLNGMPSCFGQYRSYDNSTSVPCLECGTYGNFSLQYRLCDLGQKLDELLFGQTGVPLMFGGVQRQLFQPLFCCLVGRSLRIGVAAANYPLSFVRYWTDLLRFLEDDRWIQTFFDEVGGEQNKFGGLIQCVYNFFVFTLEPRLKCIAGLVAYPSKSLSELARSILVLLPRSVATIRGSSSTQTQNLGTYLCLDSNNKDCFGVESAIQWLRSARTYPVVNATIQFNATVIYTPIVNNTNIPETFTDCACNVLNLKFISDFAGFDILGGIDICCGVKYIIRAGAEALKFVVHLVVILSQTFFGYVNGTEGSTFLLLEWIACSPANLEPIGTVTGNNFYCSNIINIASDLQDFGGCPCVFFLDINVLILSSSSGNPSQGFNCLCDLFSSLTNIILASLRSVMAFVLGLLKVSSCLIKETVPLSTPDCTTDLTARFFESFGYIDVALLEIEALFSAIGCTIGTLFGFATGGRCLAGTVTPCPFPDVQCFVGDKLGAFLGSAASAIVSVVKSVVDIFVGLLSAALTGSSANGVVPLSIVQFLLDLIQGISSNLWGEPGPPATDGALQQFGIFLSCAFGPVSCGDQCSGTPFLLVGNQIRALWGDPDTEGLSCLIFNLLFFVETLILQTKSNFCVANGYAAGGSCAEQHLLKFITCFFTLLFDLLFNPQTNVFDFFLDVLNSIVSLIPVVGFILSFIVTTFKAIVDFLFSVGTGIIKYVICLVTTGDLFNNGSCSATSSFKRSADDEDPTGSGGGIITGIFMERVNKLKRTVQDKMASSLPNFTSTEAIIYNVTALIDSIDKTSFCGRAIQRSIHKYTGKDPSVMSSIGLEEEILFKMCYGFTLFPYFFNAYSRDYATSVNTNPDSINNLLNITSLSQKRQEDDQPEYQFGTVPPNFITNPILGLNFARNVIGAFGHYVQWRRRPATQSIYKPSPNSYTSDYTIDDFSSPLNLSDAKTLDVLFQFNGSPNQKRQDNQVEAQIDDSIYRDISFSDYLDSQGISCPHTVSLYRSIDNMHQKAVALNLWNLRTGAAVMRQVAQPTPIEPIVPLKRDHPQHPMAKVMRVAQSYTKAFSTQYTAYKNLVQSIKKIGEGRIGELMDRVGHNFTDIGMGKSLLQHNHLDGILGPRSSFDYEKPPIFFIPAYNKKRGHHQEPRIPIVSMANYLYKNIPKFAYIYVSGGIGKIKESYGKRPNDHWTVFKKENIFSNAISSPQQTSWEKIYSYTKYTAERFRGPMNWPLDEFIKEVELGRNLTQKRATPLGCKIVDKFVDETVSIFQYCAQRYYILPNGTIGYNTTFVKSLPRFIPIPLATVPYNASAPSGAAKAFPIINTFYSAVGYDVLETIVSMLETVNADPREGNIGFLYFIYHSPFIGKCIRGVDDTCTFGYGIGKALFIGLVLTLILFFLYLFMAPAANMIVNLIILLGGVSFILSMMLTIAYGYNIACGQPGGTTFLFGTVIPITYKIPALPECAGPDFANTFNNLNSSECGFFSSSLKLLTLNSTCQDCNTPKTGASEFQNCQSFGYPSFTNILANDIYVYFPALTRFINTSCFGRGGCLSPSTSQNLGNYQMRGLTKSVGSLSFLIPSNDFVNNYVPSSGFGQQYAACSDWLWPSRISWIILIGVILFIFGFVVLPVIEIIARGILDIIRRLLNLIKVVSISNTN